MHNTKINAQAAEDDNVLVTICLARGVKMPEGGYFDKKKE